MLYPFYTRVPQARAIPHIENTMSRDVQARARLIASYRGIGSSCPGGGLQLSYSAVLTWMNVQ